MRIKEITSVRKRYGYRRIHVLMLRVGWIINHKRVYMLFWQEGLNLRKPSTRKKSAPEKGVESAVNEWWCIYFVSDQLNDGKDSGTDVLDTFSREILAICVDKSIKGRQVCEELEKIQVARGLPQRIKVDNGSTFISRALDAWAYFSKVKLDYSRPGTPADNPHVESFTGSFRDVA